MMKVVNFISLINSSKLQNSQWKLYNNRTNKNAIKIQGTLKGRVEKIQTRWSDVLIE